MRRMLLAGVLLPGLIFAFAPASYLSRGLGFTPWGFALPSGEVLREALRSCQFVRYSGREYTLCPQRLAYRDFPKHLANALIASEDRAFFEHHGIDKRAILHAALTNIGRSLRERRLVTRRGGSTITQQFARTLFLDERAGFGRKLEEVALAPRIEATLSKRQILAGYMNIVPHARGMNGFDAAARHFFGVPVGSVDLAEAALLVGMLPAPNDRDPVRRPEPAYEAAVRVLERMEDQGMIGGAELKRAESLLRSRILGRKLKRGRTALRHEETRPYRDLAVAEAKQNGAPLDDDYRLISHMDPGLQDRIVDATRRIAGRYQAAGVFIRPTGEVLGIAGSRDYVESSLNRAFQSTQPIGSTGKLFVLVAAHESALDPKRQFSDRPLRDGGWPAEPNRQCRHDMTLAQAFAESCNRPFAWAAVELENKLTRVVNRFELKPPDAPVLVPLGGIEASPLMLARSYAAVANDGGLPPVRALVAALGRAGNILHTPSTDAQRVMSSEAAAAVLRTLRAPVHHGTARHAASRRAVVYGKTGTTTGNQDALFVGMTKDFVGAFWVGADNNRSMRGVVGSGAPAKAFARVTDAYYATKPKGAGGGDRPSGSIGSWRWSLGILQNREHRYYALAGFAALMIATFWLQYRRSGMGWLVRSKFGMQPLALTVVVLWRALRKLRFMGWRSKRRPLLPPPPRPLPRGPRPLPQGPRDR